MVVLTKEMQGGNINASRQQSNYSTYSSYQEMQGCRRNEMQTKHTDALN